MKKISGKSIASFFTMQTASAVFAGGATYGIIEWMHQSHQFDLRNVGLIAAFFMSSNFVMFRLWLKFFPTPVGEVPDSEVWHVHVYQLFYLMIFNPLLRSGILPTPLQRVVFLLMGAKLDDNTYSGGIIYDCHLVMAGKNCLFGQNSVLTPHQMEGDVLGYYPIVIGDNVTLGVNSVILPGVTIESNASVASGAVVLKGTLIKKGEIWGGIPARKISGPVEKSSPVKYISPSSVSTEDL